VPSTNLPFFFRLGSFQRERMAVWGTHTAILRVEHQPVLSSSGLGPQVLNSQLSAFSRNLLVTWVRTPVRPLFFAYWSSLLLHFASCVACQELGELCEWFWSILRFLSQFSSSHLSEAELGVTQQRWCNNKSSAPTERESREESATLRPASSASCPS
jgi:hypothetical protein